MALHPNFWFLVQGFEDAGGIYTTRLTIRFCIQHIDGTMEWRERIIDLTDLPTDIASAISAARSMIHRYIAQMAGA